MKKCLLIAAAVLLAAAGWLEGQALHARIDGYIQDEEGRFLAGVTVTATNVVSNAEAKVVSDRGNGGFRFLGLAPGTYQVSCDLEGYQSYVASGIRLSAGQSTTLRVKLKPLPGTEAPPAEDDLLADAIGPWKRWQVELSIGGLTHDPDDLNLFVDHDQLLIKERYLLYLRDPRFIARPIYGTGMGLGVLHSVTNRWPLTLRLRLRLNRTFSLAAGLDWTDQQQNSHYVFGASFSYPAGGTGFDVKTDISGYRLGLRTFFPHLGAQATLPINPFVSVAGFVHAGWAFVECSHASTRRFQDGFAGEDRLYEIGMKGKGNGPAAEAGAKFEFILWRGFGLFTEGIYQFFKVNDVSGNQFISETILDGGSSSHGTVISESREGRWKVANEPIAWPLIPQAWEDEYYRPFSLDLGGFGFRLGAFFRF